MKKFIPLGTALLSLLAICGVFFKYVKETVEILGTKTSAEIAFFGNDGVMKHMSDYKGDTAFLKTSSIFYIIALVLLVLVIAIAVLNFLGIGGKSVGYAFIAISALSFIVSLIATIMLFKTVLIVKFSPSLALWWTTGFAFLAMLSTGNVLLGKKRK